MFLPCACELKATLTAHWDIGALQPPLLSAQHHMVISQADVWIE